MSVWEKHYRKKTRVIFFISVLSEDATLGLAFVIQKCYCSQGGFKHHWDTDISAEQCKQGKSFDKASHVQRRHWNP